MLKWFDVNKDKPAGNNDFDIDVVVRIFGLSQNASEYAEYKIVKWRESIKCFIEWGYNSKGEFISTTYNNSAEKLFWPKHPMVTHWAYFNMIKGD